MKSKKEWDLALKVVRCNCRIASVAELVKHGYDHVGKHLRIREYHTLERLYEVLKTSRILLGANINHLHIFKRLLNISFIAI
jgi:hypothetical protein